MTTNTANHEMRAHRALVQTLPLFEMMRMRAATTARRHPLLGYAGEARDSTLRWVNQFTHTHRKLGPDDREVVSPNNDTVYSNAWLDLSRGPVLIDTPDMGDRYWTLGLLDAWTNPFAYVGRRTTGNRLQRTLVHGPRWKGSVPADVTHVIDAPGDDVWLIGRILVDDSAGDIEAVRALQAQLRMTRLDGSDAAMRVDTRIDGRLVATPASTTYTETVSAALEGNPPPQGELLEWPLDAALVEALLPGVFEELRQKDQPRQLGGGWSLQLEVRTHWGADVLTRARVARNFIGALGMEEAMYPTAEADGEGRVRRGQHHRQPQQLKQGAEQAGDEAAEQAQGAQTQEVTEEVEHLVRAGPHAHRLLQPQHVEGRGHGGHDDGDEQAQYQGHVHVTPFLADIGGQQGVAQQDPDCHDPGDGQRQTETGAAGLLPGLFQHPLQVQTVSLAEGLFEGSTDPHSITQLTIQHSKATVPRWHIIAV